MLLFVDGCSHYTQAFLAQKWDVVNAIGTAITQTPAANGRFGGGAITFINQGNSFDSPYYIQKNYNGVSTIVVGMAIRQTATQNTYGGQWLSFMSGSTVQVALAILPSGQIAVYRATNNSTGYNLHPTEGGKRTYLGTSTNAINSSSYDFLEVKVTHHATLGSVEIKRNGAPFFLLTNTNTDPANTFNSSSVLVGGYASFGGASLTCALQAYVTDFYLLNTTAVGADPGNPVDFIGDRHWQLIRPTADLTYTEWTPVGTPAHFDNVEEVPPSVADYNATDVVGKRDSLDTEILPGPAGSTVLMAYTMYLQKDGGGPVGISGLMRSPAGAGGVDGVGTEFQTPNPYGVKQSFLCTNPNGNVPITVAAFNAAEHGYKRTS